jgi:UDP-N-acetylglucosamine 3-dehydrogenase
MNRFRVGLIGVGSMGRHHARVLRALDRVELVVAADPSGDVHGTLDGLPVVADVSELLRYHLDYAIVACSTSQHEAVGVALANAGVPALIEKPLADSVGGAKRLVDAFAANGLPASVGHIERYNPAVTTLRACLEDGKLGELFQIATRRRGPSHDRSQDVHVVHDLAIHDIDLTSWLTGAEYRSVTAKSIRVKGRQTEDAASIIGRLDIGIVVSHLVTRISPFKERVAIVTGEKGCLVADNLGINLTFFAFYPISGKRTAIAQYALPKQEPLIAEHEAFRDHIDGRPGHGIVTLPEGLRTLLVAAAVLDSAATGSEVTVIPQSAR